VHLVALGTGLQLTFLLLGLLAVGSQSGLSVHTLMLDNDLLTWSQKWMSRCVFLAACLVILLIKSSVTSPSLACFAPSLTYIATTSLVRMNCVDLRHKLDVFL
jgi:hypothetical protein